VVQERPFQNDKKEEDPSFDLSQVRKILAIVQSQNHLPAAKTLLKFPLFTSTAVAGPASSPWFPKPCQVLFKNEKDATLAAELSGSTMEPEAIRTFWFV
jgi:hypothetical protein